MRSDRTSSAFMCVRACACGGGWDACLRVCVGGGGGYHIKEEGLHGSRGGRPAEGACAKEDV